MYKYNSRTSISLHHSLQNGIVIYSSQMVDSITHHVVRIAYDDVDIRHSDT